jgi:hypothetical protein
MPVKVHFRRACHCVGIGTQPMDRRLSNLRDRRKQLAGGGRDLAGVRATLPNLGAIGNVAFAQ